MTTSDDMWCQAFEMTSASQMAGSASPVPCGEKGENYTRGIWNGPDGGERIWIEVHDDGTLTAANDTLDGCIKWGDTLTIEGETDEHWGNCYPVDAGEVVGTSR